MSALSALYDAYVQAEKDDLIDRHDLTSDHTVILPIYHSNRRSDGWNVLELTIDKATRVLNCDFVPDREYVVFPVTEASATRTGNIDAHPLCDQLVYVSAKLDAKKFASYKKEVNAWWNYTEDHDPDTLLTTVKKLIDRIDLLDAVYEGLSKNYKVTLDAKNSFVFQIDGKEKKIDAGGLFITYRLSSGEADKADTTSTDSRPLHKRYVDYMTHCLEQKKDNFAYCDMSGNYAYHPAKHRGLIGNAKLISTSHKETHIGRFRNADEVVRLSYEASEKIHLMLKFFLDHSDNSTYLGEMTYALVWSSDHIYNSKAVDEKTGERLANENAEADNPAGSTKRIDVLAPGAMMDDLYADFVDDDLLEDNSDKDISDIVSRRIGNAMLGLQNILSPEGRFHILIINKISNGRLAIQYFRELSNSELLKNLANWYKGTTWPRYSKEAGKIIDRSPNLFQIVDALYGDENDNGYTRCENKNLRTLAVKRLLPCIVDGRALPRDFARLAYINFTKRNSYDNSWPYILYIACSMLNKTHFDQTRGRETIMLDENRQSRDYLYGRLLALYEKLEKDAMSAGKDDSDTAIRETNAQKLWSAFINNPERTIPILEDKLQPYKKRLRANRPNSFIYYDKLIGNVLNLIRESDHYDSEKNRALREDTVFGYYAQNRALYEKKSKTAAPEDANK